MYAWFAADKNRRIKFGISMIVLIAGIILLILDFRYASGEIKDGILRNSYGEGTKTEELEVWIDKERKEKLNIEISERKYKENETDKMLKECIRQIEKEMLGENESPDYVTKDLNFMTELPGRPIDIDWNLESFEVLNIYGEIQEEGLEENGTAAKIQAVVTYTENPEKQALYECMVMVYPEKLSDRELLLKKIHDEIQKKDVSSQTNEKLELPESVDGKNISYYRKMDFRGIVLIIMAVITGILFYVQEFQNQGKERKKRQSQMMMDYPEIINKLTLFLGAGMTMKRAFRKIVTDYEDAKRVSGVRFAYEEMKVTCREMESGIPEAESYERFGKRCNIQEYIRLGALLSQNIRKGTKGLSHILRLEAIQAFENRKAMAKKAGEEAGTRLLLPMFIMFGVVLVMVIVPAFWSMKL